MTETAVAGGHPAEASSPKTPEVLRNFVGGRWIESGTSEFFDVHNPARGEVIARAPLSTSEDLDLAVAAARQAFPAWRDTPAVVRAR
ncbi:MAG TPA: aldehyde dehydrogenase family protein, partial [Thermoanaerobaculia bacterium]|nr:aldehyde dehydrogenase family protein [Thermoanaerobaculia bacterium]